MTSQQPSRDPLDVGPGGPVSQALAQVVRLHRAAAGELLKSTGLYPGQEVLMMHLWAAGVVRQADLINALGLDPSTVTKMLQRLQRAGKVSRTTDPAARLDPAERAELHRLLEKVAAYLRLQNGTCP